MNKRHILFAFYFLSACLIVFFVVFLFDKIKTDDNFQGQYSFVNTRKNLKNLSHIIIKTPIKEVNLIKHDGAWHFSEANDYFVNNESLANLFNMFNKSTVLSKHENEQANYAINIQTFNDKNDLLDSVYFYKRINNSDRAVVSYNDNKEDAYIINSIGIFSADPQAWIPYPLLSIDFYTIKSITINNKTLNREKIDYLWQHVISMEKFINTLSFINYTGITTKQDLENSYKNADFHQIKIEMIGGLVYIFNVYSLDESYWISITLDVGTNAFAEVIQFVKDNQKYFSDWIFQLDDEQGSLLYNFGYNKL